MSQSVLIKIYAHFAPVTDDVVRELEDCVSSAICAEDFTGPIVSTLGDMVRLSFEGIYFPEEEVADIVRRAVEDGASGKMDVLDLENWHMTRYEGKDHVLHKSGAPLNNVLDFSGF